MDVKEAVQAAKAHISDLFAGEEITNVGLEEVEFDDRADAWKITIGFSRPWERPGELGVRLGLKANRSFKVVHVDSEGAITSVKDRVLDAVAN